SKWTEPPTPKMAWERGLQSARRGGSIGRGGINSALRRPRRACRACRSAGILAGPARAFHPLWRTKFIGTYAAVGRISDKVTSAASTERLLPLPATEEWGEGRGEGKPCKHCPKTISTGSRRPSPWPSPRSAGRGYSWRRVVHLTVPSVTRKVRKPCRSVNCSGTTPLFFHVLLAARAPEL